jgi:ankyrin repeat protein
MQTPLMAASWSGHTSTHHARLSDRRSFLVHGVDGLRTDRALPDGASRGGSGTVSFLLSQGAEVTAADMSAKNSLILASAQGHVEVVQLLLAHVAALGKGASFRWHHYQVFRILFSSLLSSTLSARV